MADRVGSCHTPLANSAAVPEGQLFARAARQLGLVTRAQVLAHISVRRLRTLIHRGALEHVRPSVYRVCGAPITRSQRLLAAVLAAGPDGVASFRSAAAVWRLDGPEPDAIEITVPEGCRLRLDGVLVHQSNALTRRHVTQHEGIPVTTVARTLCDLTAVWLPWMVERAVDDAIRRRLTTERELAATLHELTGRGRRRCTVMREIIEARIPGLEVAESRRESELVQWLVGAGLPAPLLQHRVRTSQRTIRIDLSYPDAMLAIEYDGWDAHRTRTAFDRDRARGNELEIRGWTVLRFTAASTPELIVATVREALELRTVPRLSDNRGR